MSLVINFAVMTKLFLVLTFFGLTAIAQQKPTQQEENGLVKWLDFKEAFEQNKKQQKPFLIDVYTDWCGWCKHMMKTTYSNPDLASYINTYFYPVKFNAETTDTIEYLGTKYVNPEPQRKRSVHQLAVKLLGPNQSYPSTVFAGNNLQFTLLTSGYLDVKKIEPLLIYMVENVFRTTGYNEFEAYYKKAFPENPADTLRRVPVSRYTFADALELSKKTKKKILLDIYTNWCNGCKVMNNTTFTDSSIAKYINDNFYLVPFNAETKESLNFKGTEFPGAANGMFHQFVPAVLKNNVILPSLVIFNEEHNIVDVLPFYMSPKLLEPVLHFYGDDAYKSVKWQDYQKEFSKKKN